MVRESLRTTSVTKEFLVQYNIYFFDEDLFGQIMVLVKYEWNEKLFWDLGYSSTIFADQENFRFIDCILLAAS